MRLRAPLRSPSHGLDVATAAYARASPPGNRTPWRQAGWCVVDFELTGVNPRDDEIISFGAIPVDDGRVRLVEASSALVRPAREIEEAAIRVHGIRAVDLADAPRLADAIAPLIETIAGRGLVFIPSPSTARF